MSRIQRHSAVKFRQNIRHTSISTCQFLSFLFSFYLIIRRDSMDRSTWP